MTPEEQRRAQEYDEHPLVKMAPVFKALFGMKMVDRGEYIDNGIPYIALSNGWAKITWSLGQFQLRWTNYSRELRGTGNPKTLRKVIARIRKAASIASRYEEDKRKEKENADRRVNEMRAIFEGEEITEKWMNHFNWNKILNFGKADKDGKFEIHELCLDNCSKEFMVELMDFLKKELFIRQMVGKSN